MFDKQSIVTKDKTIRLMAIPTRIIKCHATEPASYR